MSPSQGKSPAGALSYYMGSFLLCDTKLGCGLDENSGYQSVVVLGDVLRAPASGSRLASLAGGRGVFGSKQV